MGPFLKSGGWGTVGVGFWKIAIERPTLTNMRMQDVLLRQYQYRLTYPAGE